MLIVLSLNVLKKRPVLEKLSKNVSGRIQKTVCPNRQKQNSPADTRNSKPRLIKKIKIDQSFIRNIPHDENDIAITKTIIGLARNLNLAVIAEGIETTEQQDFLIANG